MNRSISFYDSGAEGFYHGLVLGLIAMMDNQYKIKSNRESGDGRYDICLIPRDKKYPGIIMELKSDKDRSKIRSFFCHKQNHPHCHMTGYYTTGSMTNGKSNNIMTGENCMLGRDYYG